VVGVDGTAVVVAVVVEVVVVVWTVVVVATDPTGVTGSVAPF